MKLYQIPVNRSDLGNNIWFKANFNPYGNPYVGDCMIRAVSAALMMKYKTVCQKLGVGIKIGFGANTGKGVSISDLKPLTEYFDIVAQTKNETIENFVKSCGSKRPYGIYVVCLEKHTVCVCAVSSSQKYFVDTWDSSQQTIQLVLKVKKQASGADRLTLSEFKKTQQIFANPKIQQKFQKLAR